MFEVWINFGTPKALRAIACESSAEAEAWVSTLGTDYAPAEIVEAG